MLTTALELVRYLRRSGGEIDVDDGALCVNAPAGVLTEEIKNELVTHKADILSSFSQSIHLLNERGVRLVSSDGRTVALWRDADGREVRDALDAVGLGDAKVEYLEDPEAEIADRYRQFIPEYVRSIWSQQGLLATPAERLRAEAKARYINRFFNALGPRYRPSRVLPSTVLHGMLAVKKRAGAKK